MNVPNQIKSNDTLNLNPKTKYREPILEFDFPGLKIGIGEYEEGPTGCSVFHFDKKVRFTSDIRGGAPGVVGEHFSYVDAVVFSGGSLLGYESFSGVLAELLKLQKYEISWERFPLVSGAIIWDFGPRPNNTIYPDKALGRAALCNTKENIFPMGNQGAGVSATVGKILDFSFHEKGGQGGACLERDQIKILAFSVVNAVGSIINRNGKVIRGHFDPVKKEYVDLAKYLDKKSNEGSNDIKGNTTLTLVVTNRRFNSYYEFQQVSKQIHASIARAIQPFHCLNDGDVLFMVTTEEIDDSLLTLSQFGVLAGEVAWDAVMSCIEEE
jgi:L-aminopeptidase/D-esterase-like protein